MRWFNQLLLAGKQSCALILLLMLSMSWLTVQAAPIQRAITISGSSSTPATFSDWTTADNSTTPTIIADWGTVTDVTNNTGQFSTDAQYQDPCTATPADLDCSATAAGVGRDLKKFTYTWDSSNLYMYVERFSSSTSANDWWFYIDANNDGLMNTGEIVLNVSWTGSNGRTTRQLWSYTSSRAAGDPLTCPAAGANSFATGYCPVVGKGDGYDMPGTISAGATFISIYGGATAGSGVDSTGASLAGVVMETFVTWADLGLSGPGSVGFHISSSNGTNLPTQLDDNMDSLGSGGGGISFADTAISKTASSATVVGGDQFTYTLTVTNNGDSDANNIEVTDVLPTNTTYSSDDSATTSTTTALIGSTLTWDIPVLANGASISLVVTMDSAIVAVDTLVSNTADITDQDEADSDATNNSDSVDITLIAAPDLTIVKSHVGSFSEGSNGAYTIAVTNSGDGDETGVVTVTDVMPTGLAFVSGTGTGWTCVSDFPTSPETVTCTNPGPLLSGDSLASITLTVSVAAAAVPSVTNTAVVTGTTYENVTGNNSSSDITNVTSGTSQSCYAVDGNNNILSLVDTSDFNAASNETNIGVTGVTGINAVAYDCGSGTLYAANSGQIGTLNQATGGFSALGAAGSSSNGSLAPTVVSFTNIDGLAHDPSSGALYGSVNRSGTDVLIQINKATGAFVPNAFGAGVDYVTIGSIASISDISITSGGQMYGVDDGANSLLTINKLLGTTGTVGALGITNVKGLGTDGAGGLWGSTANGAITENVYEVSSGTGAASNPRPIDGGGGTSFDYDAYDCIANCALRQSDLSVALIVSNAAPLEAASIVYTITVTNNGPDAASTVQINDLLPAGVTYVSDVPSQGSYDDTTGDWYVGNIANGDSVTLQINVTVDAGTAGSTITNTASVTYATQDDPTSANNTASVDITPVNSNLSTSTKTGVDLNGGNPEAGDIIRYTITLQESAGAAANGVSVTDDMPANTGSFTVISIPVGATDSSTPGGGANGTGFLDITGINVAASGSETIVFDVTILAGTPNGTSITNTATVNNPSGPGATPSASPFVVAGGVETKTLYLQGNNALTRVQHATSTVTAIASGGSNTWTLTPSTYSAMTLDSSLSIAVPIWITSTNNNTGAITATLAYSGGSTGTVGSANVSLVKNTTQRYTFSINFGADILINPATVFTLTIANGSNKSLSVDAYNAGATTYSQIDLNSFDVINVNNVEFYDAAYPGGNLKTAVIPNTTVYIRSQVQDPFGSFDINSATIEIQDSSTTTRVAAGTAMTQVNDSLAGTKTYEYTYLVPAAGPTGTWTALVTANEGTEGTVSHTATGNLLVRDLPLITLLKMVQTTFDPVNLGSNPKAIPGAYLGYTIIATNSGAGYVDTDTMVFADPIPANTELFVNDLGGGGSGPVLFSDGATTSALTYTFTSLDSTTDDIEFSDDNGATWVYYHDSDFSNIDADGFDSTLTNIRVNPKGQFAGAAGTNPSFSLIFRVRLQ
jgi:uncharacterized repeat protein (TIGR01451 family)